MFGEILGLQLAAQHFKEARVVSYVKDVNLKSDLTEQLKKSGKKRSNFTKR